MFLQKLIRPDFSSVTKLDFIANGRLNTFFGPFFSRLQSLERISVDLKTLSHLAHLQKQYIDKATNKPTVMFPILQTINLFIHTYPSRNIIFCQPSGRDIPSVAIARGTSYFNIGHVKTSPRSPAQSGCSCRKSMT